MNRNQRHYIAGRAGVKTFCGLPVVAQSARVTSGIWQPARYNGTESMDDLSISLCRDCHDANAALRAPFTSVSYDPR